jgi:putative flippase GtrA
MAPTESRLQHLSVLRMSAALLRQIRSRQFWLFVAASGTSAFLQWISRILLNEVMPYGAALVVAYGVGIAVAYLLNMRFVFLAATRPINEQVRYFVLVNVIAFPFVWTTAYVLAEIVFPWIGFTYHPRAVAHAIAIGILVVNYVTHKYFTFREAYAARS